MNKLKILSGSQKRPEAKDENGRSRKKGASNKYFNHWVYPEMPYHALKMATT